MNSFVYIMFHGDFFMFKKWRPDDQPASGIGSIVRRPSLVYDHTISYMFNKTILMWINIFIYIYILY